MLPTAHEAAAAVAAVFTKKPELARKHSEYVLTYYATCEKLRRTPLPANERTIAAVYYEISRTSKCLDLLRRAIVVLHDVFNEANPTCHPYLRTILLEHRRDLRMRLRRAARHKAWNETSKRAKARRRKSAATP
jgi:hypothetical protein